MNHCIHKTLNFYIKKTRKEIKILSPKLGHPNIEKTVLLKSLFVSLSQLIIEI